MFWLWLGLKIRDVVCVRGRVRASVMIRAAFRFRPNSRVIVGTCVMVRPSAGLVVNVWLLLGLVLLLGLWLFLVYDY